MKPILAIFPILLLYWNSAAQNIESITLRIDQVLNLKTNELSGGDGSYISYSKGSAEVRFYPETKIIDRTALDRNYIEREGSVSDFKVDRKGRYKFRINIEDNHNTQDFYIDVAVDLENKVYNGTVYYYGKPQSWIIGPITYLKMEGESKATIPSWRKNLPPKEPIASFDGGSSNKFQIWVDKHKRYPRKAKKQGLHGRVIVRFTIDETGKLVDAKVIIGVDEILDKEALRVVLAAPDKWLPALKYGKPVKQTYTLPVIFEKQDKK